MKGTRNEFGVARFRDFNVGDFGDEVGNVAALGLDVAGLVYLIFNFKKRKISLVR